METIENNKEMTFASQKTTGKVMFKFDDDEPQLLTEIWDNGKFTLTLENDTESVPYRSDMRGFVFNSKCGKRFQIFIEKLDE